MRRALRAALAVLALAVGLAACGQKAVGGAAGSAAAATTTTRRRSSRTTSTLGGQPPASGLATIRADALPPEARRTLALIDAGGPFPSSRDGVVFENREHVLPAERRGYYHEYTVETPGSPDRGARRLVSGARGERFWSPDHYASFLEVVRG